MLHPSGSGASNSAHLIVDDVTIYTGNTTGLAYGKGDLYIAAGALGSACYLYDIDPATA